MSFNLLLNGNRVAIELDQVSDERTRGGLYVPQTAQGEGPKTGTVAAASKGYHMNGVFVASSFKKGAKVLVDTLGSTKVVVDQKEYVLVRNEDILGEYVG